ncbi:hypothetical protein ACFL7M_17565 [Thermodesulfobacteriota bacterium]
MKEAPKVLTSGIDTIVISVDVGWTDRNFFEYLTELKKKAKDQDQELPGMMKGIENEDGWLFLLKPFGAKGYEWILSGKEFTMRIGKWMEPKSRPSVIVDIRSETLWRKGPKESCERILMLIENNGGIILKVRSSRTDLCLDIMISDKIWSLGLINNLTRRANKILLVLGQANSLETLQVGVKGKIIGRMYDKELEIKQKSKKKWMYGIWGIEKCEEGKKIIRVEFELKRDALKELGMGDLIEFFRRCDEVWSYCTRKWMKFERNKEEHHRKRETLEWWKVVQNGFLGVQDASPAIREKAIKEDADQLRNQIVGYTTSLTALVLDKYEIGPEEKISFKDCINSVMYAYEANGNSINDFQKLLIKKRAKYLRTLNSNINCKS